MSLNVLKLDLNSARWMRKLVSIDAQSYAALTSQSLRGTIGPLQDTELIPYPLRQRNLRNLTLQQECYLTNTRAISAYARLYNAAASPASRLRSAGSLAIIGY